MTIHTYAKLHEPLSIFDTVLDIIRQPDDELTITTENTRCFRSLEHLKESSQDDIFLISNLSSLGTNDADIATQLTWFINHQTSLVICEIPSTYEFGVLQPINQAVLSTILQALLNGNKNIITISTKKSTAGRNKLPFPDNWDDLYQKWCTHEITSKDFILKTGLKKATFYNLLSEYKEIQLNNQQYLTRYKII